MNKLIKTFIFSIVAAFLIFSEFSHENKTVEHNSQQVEINIELEVENNEIENDELIKIISFDTSDRIIAEFSTELNLLEAQYAPQIIIPPPDFTYL